MYQIFRNLMTSHIATNMAELLAYGTVVVDHPDV